jgi:hypothetical protein
MAETRALIGVFGVAVRTFHDELRRLAADWFGPYRGPPDGLSVACFQPQRKFKISIAAINPVD